MADVLTPGPKRLDGSGGLGASGARTPVVPLAAAAQVLRGTYFNPLRAVKPEETPLPPHQWELHTVRDQAADPLIVVKGTRSSQSTGISTIINGKKLREARPDQKWFLILRPDISEEQLEGISAPGLREIWIDLEKNQWVLPQGFPVVEKRKLLRLPLWRSNWKARLGGLSPRRRLGDHISADYAMTGEVTTAEILKPFSTPADPWEIQVDVSWFRTFLQFHFYDHTQGKSVPVPPGLCVKILGKKLDFATLQTVNGRVGGGTSIDDHGTIYVLHERTTEQSSDAEIFFEDPAGLVLSVDLSGKPPSPGAKDTRLRRQHPSSVPARPDERYILPDSWHSHGMEARVGSGPRKKWHELRPTPLGAPVPRSLDTSRSNPLIFHFDDTILVHATKGPVGVPRGSRITLFDRALAFRQPMDPVLQPLWSGKLDENYLRAEEVIVGDAQPWQRLTFVIDLEGEFFVLRDARVNGALGVTPCIGARKAVAHAVEDPIGDFLAGNPRFDGGGTTKLMLIPDAYPGPYTNEAEGAFLGSHPTASFCHLLVYVPIKVIADPTDPSVTPANLTAVHAFLMQAAERWDQAHPTNGAADKKDYVVVPRRGVKNGSRIVKLRHYFGLRFDGGEKLTVSACNTNQINGVPFNRSFVSDHTLSLIVGGAGPDASDKATPDSDGLALPWFTLAHEFGHVMGLPDEYLETLAASRLALDTLTEPRVPRFAQAHDAYPFYGDRCSVMNNNQLPRLRYVWHHVTFLNQEARSQMPEGPYVTTYASFKGGTTHEMPDGGKEHPWKEITKKRASGDKATLVLFKLGDDESSLEKIFPRPTKNKTDPGAWLNAVVVVRTLIWFNFVPSAAGDFPSDAERWKMVRAFYSRIYTSDREPMLRFFIGGPSAAKLPRIGLIFEPRIEFGPDPNPKSGWAPPNMTESDADLVVDVIFQNPGAGPPAPRVPPASTPPVKPPRFEVNRGDVGLSILRFALDIAPSAPSTTPDNGPLVASELNEIVRRVEEMLGASVNSYFVTDLP